MRKKVITTSAALAFIIAPLISAAQQLSRCEEIAIQLHEDLQEQGVPHEIAYEVSGLVQEICENAQS
jgi:hypothetical protein